MPLLYQAGYLTIKKYEKEFESYTIALPNEEVKYGLYEWLLPLLLAMAKAKRNADYLAKLDRSDQQLKEGRVIVKTMEELEAMAGAAVWAAVPANRLRT